MALKATLSLPLIKHNPRSKLPTLRWRPTPMQRCSPASGLSDHTTKTQHNACKPQVGHYSTDMNSCSITSSSSFWNPRSKSSKGVLPTWRVASSAVPRHMRV